MIVRLEFDLFYTTIEVPEISEKSLEKVFTKMYLIVGDTGMVLYLMMILL